MRGSDGSASANAAAASFPPNSKMLSESLKSFHDAVLVVTAPGFDDRQANCTRELGKGNFEFVFGINRTTTSKEELTAKGNYDEKRAVQLDRRNKRMTLGGICCSIGHVNAYQHMIENKIERALIFEDDVSVLLVDEAKIASIVADVPSDSELIYWGWSGLERRPRFGGVTQSIYKVQHRLGFLKYNYRMIENLYPADYNVHFSLAGKQFGAYAYSVTLIAARRLIEWNTPLALNADNAIMYAILNEDVRAYISKTRLFGEYSQGHPELIESLTY